MAMDLVLSHLRVCVLKEIGREHENYKICYHNSVFIPLHVFLCLNAEQKFANLFQKLR